MYIHNYSLDTLPRDILFSIIREGGLKNKALISLCLTSSNLYRYAKRNAKYIFMDLIKKRYPKRVDDVKPGLEMVSYFTLVEGLDHFFEKYIYMVNWRLLSKNTNISEEFFEKHIANVNWPNLSGNAFKGTLPS